jgi:hypothetical protein
MEALIDLDFKFHKYSLIYGKFLQEVHESYVDVKIEDANRYYRFKDRFSTFVRVAVPEEVAVVLKLRFGAHLCTRRVPDPSVDPDREIHLQEEINRREIYFQDYLSILKTREGQCNDISALYLDLKNISYKIT